jgi:hypothetical protein
MRNDLLILDIILNSDWKRPIYFLSTRELSKIGLDKYLYREGFAYRLLPFSKDSLNETSVLSNSNYQYNKFMNEFNWGGVNNPDVVLDWTNVRIISSMHIREQFNYAARSLILDRCIELFPNEKIPFGYSLSEIIKTYYLAGDKQKAIELFDRFRNNILAELEYYKGFDERLLPGLSNNIRMNLYYLQQLEKIKFVKGENGNEVLNDLNNYYGYFYKILN